MWTDVVLTISITLDQGVIDGLLEALGNDVFEHIDCWCPGHKRWLFIGWVAIHWLRTSLWVDAALDANQTRNGSAFVRHFGPVRFQLGPEGFKDSIF